MRQPTINVFVTYSQVQNKRGKTFIFFVIFGDPPQLILTPPPFINFSNFTREYKEVHTHITDSCCFVTASGSAIYQTEIPMLSEVNKVLKDNLIFVCSLLYFVPTPHPVYFAVTPAPRLINFQNPWSPPPPPLFNLTPIYFEPESIKLMKKTFVSMNRNILR